MIKPENYQEALRIVWNLFNEGDSRYDDSISERILADILFSSAVSIEEREIPSISAPAEQDLREFSHLSQNDEKYIAKFLLKKEGFQDTEIFSEVKHLNSRPDIFAISESKKVIVECCSCRVSKVLEYLSEENSEFWLITKGNPPWQESKFEMKKWFIFHRGENWGKFNKEIEENSLRKLKQVPDLLKI